MRMSMRPADLLYGLTCARWWYSLAATFVMILASRFPCSGMATASEADVFVQKARVATPWLKIPPGQTVQEMREDDARELNHLGGHFQRFGVAEARAIVERLLEDARRSPSPGEIERTKSTIYVLLRFYFQVPAWERDERARAFGGYLGVPEEHGRVNTLWPLAADANGSIRLRSTYRGYSGEPYDALGEFDYFKVTYGPHNSGNSKDRKPEVAPEPSKERSNEREEWGHH